MTATSADALLKKKSIKEELKVYAERSTVKGVTQVLSDFAVLVLWIGLALCVPWWWLQLLFALLAGGAIATLFVLGHDAAHSSLAPSKWLNHTLGRLALAPALHCFSLWQREHNRIHHRWPNLAPKDNTWTPLSLEQYKANSLWMRGWYRFTRSWLGILLYYPVECWIKCLMFPWPWRVEKYRLEYVIDVLVTYSFAIGYGCLLYFGNQAEWFGGIARPWWNPFLFGAVIPFAAWNVFMGFAVYLMHTHPDVIWYDDEAEWKRVSQATVAVHVIFPYPMNAVFHHIMEHNVHHLHPSIPSYNLQAAQDALEARHLQDDDEDEIVVFHWTILRHLDVARQCKLYDFENKRWVNYQGQPTGAA